MASATSGRPFAALLVTLAVFGAACTACTAPPAPGAQRAGPALDRRQVCFGPAPAGWTDAGVSVPGTFGVHAVAGDVAFGQLTDTGVVAVDLASGGVRTVARYGPGVSGLGALAVQEPWVVWEQLNSTTNLSDWSVHALNRDTGEQHDLATARLPGGGFLPGQQPLPVLRDGIAAWAQPLAQAKGAAGGPVQAELRAVDLGTGASRVLDTGRLSSPVHAGPYLVWAKVDAAGYLMRAVDAKTLEPAELPEPLRRTGSVAYLGGSPDLLAWSSHDGAALEVWRFSTGRRASYATDGRHPFQFLHLAGDFLFWYGGVSSSVLDLRSGAALDVAGTVTGSAGWIVTAVPSAASTRVSRVAAGRVPSLACAP